MWHLLTAHQQESFLPFSSRQSLSCCLSRVAKRNTPKPRSPLYSPSEPCGPFPHFRTAWSSLSFTSEPHVPLPFPSEPCGFLYLLCQSCMILSFLPQNLVVLPLLWLPRLGLNPSTHLLLQPHSRLLLQSATPASIPIFFQLHWAAIVSLGRCGPLAWSQSSPSSPTGPVTRGSCFPVPSWVEFGLSLIHI